MKFSGASAILRWFAILLCGFSLSVSAQNDTGWSSVDLGFRPVSVTWGGTSFWASGSDGGIASSPDGKNWTTQHPVTSGGPLLLGIEFPTSEFGFAYGSGGQLLKTTDSGHTWTPKQLGNDTLLLASFSDPDHGIVRTVANVFSVNGTNLTPVSLPSAGPKNFKYVPAVAALSPTTMAFAVAEGWRSRVGFVATTDGGKSWSFYEPPHIVTYNFLRQGDRYWAIGNETVDYDKPGGGYGVPAVIHSSDGAIWEHTKANVHPCHWQGCHVCNTSGCLASKSLFIDPYGTQATFHEIPAGHLSAAWAAHENEICTIDGTLYCANMLPAADPEKGGGSTAPSERYWPVLGPAPSRGLLRCISCSLEPFLVDPNVSGRFTVHISFVVRQDGTPESVVVEKAPSDGIKAKLREQMLAWIYESPMKDNHPVKVSSQGDIMINVIRSR